MYVKIFQDILDSSVWDEPVATRIVWLTMLIMADESGVVRASVSGIRRRAGVSKEDVKEAMKTLQDPDVDSKDQSYGGRRIERVDGGWLVLNYLKYREIRTRKQIRDAERQARKRQRDRDMSQQSQDITTIASASASASESEKEDDIIGIRGAKSEAEYVRACVAALNAGMEENPTLDGEWMPVVASGQFGRVTWYEDQIPLDLVCDLILDRAGKYKSTADNRGPRSLRYFDGAVREAWKGSREERSTAAVLEAFSKGPRA